MTIRCWVDGACRPNPGKGGIGVCFRGDVVDYDISELCPIARVSNNQAEYFSLIRALSELLNLGFHEEEIVLYSDAEMIVLQMSGERKVDKGGAYVPQHFRAKELVKHFPHLKIEWIAREENYEANMLASKAVK